MAQLKIIIQCTVLDSTLLKVHHFKGNKGFELSKYSTSLLNYAAYTIAVKLTIKPIIQITQDKDHR